MDFRTTKTVPHIHYVELSRVTAIKALHISDLCQSEIAFNPDVRKEKEGSRKKATGAEPDFSKGGSQCVKVSILTRLSCPFRHVHRSAKKLPGRDAKALFYSPPNFQT